MSPSSSIARPFLKWAGGKHQLIAQYQPYFPKEYQTYYEPFLGGGAIFFHLQPKQAILSDINPELVNVYQCVRDHIEALITLLHKHQEAHNHDYYYQIRSATTLDPIWRAARFLYLNKTCFNGLYRENTRGEFNVPIGRYKNPAICNPSLLRLAASALQNICIEVCSFDEILKKAHSPTDFVYLDPPYHPLSPTSSFTSYSRYTFAEAEQIRLRNVMQELTSRRVKVMLSNSDCQFIRELYQGFHIHTIFAGRAINSQAKGRGKISEVLITSYS
ncbi:MAG: DNA adenine methylase [Cyanobacteriota bacterium]|nr:DNA adenine methylase [Cyanobacteriota bacterium]